MSAIINKIINGLPNQTSDKILKICDTIDLHFGTVLCEADKPLEWVYFPLTSFISLVTTLHDHQPLEMGLIGNEGMLGASLILGVDRAPLRAIVQGNGTALRMRTKQFYAALDDCPHLATRINHYIYVMIAQLAQVAACTHFHEIEPRLARWLLMTHDRAHNNHFHLTQEFLASMLGVRRSGITIAAGILQTKKLIHYSRGEIHILDRQGLEKIACECYEDMLADYEQIFA